MEVQNLVLDETRNLLNEFEKIKIRVGNKKINIPEVLRNTPRSGYLVRVKKNKLKVTVPSVYDHILKLALSMDIFIRSLNFKYDVKLLAMFCAYHDLAESIVGDAPEFTTKKIAGKHFMEESEKMEQEKKANATIAENLDGELKTKFVDTVKLLSDGEVKKIPELEFFRFMDKAESILVLWQNIFQEREKVGSIDKFVVIMEDFFNYPLIRFTFDDATYKVAKFIQDTIKFKDYFSLGREPFYESGYSGFNYTFMLEFIEKTKISLKNKDESLKRNY